MRLAPALILGFAAGAAAGQPASPHDGLYRPAGAAPDAWDCTRIGEEGGALAVRDGRLFGIGYTCHLSLPVEVRGMTATLYDAICATESAAYEERIMLLSTEDGLVVVRPDGAETYARCPG